VAPSECSQRLVAFPAMRVICCVLRGACIGGSPSRDPADHQILVTRAHLGSLHDGDMNPALYAIRINGHLGAMLLSAFPAMVTEQQGQMTVLTGVLDQSALYGVLAEIESLGLDLLEVRQLPQERETPQPK
jgi:hypothetical protein